MRHKKRSQLDEDVRQAELLGFGCHYGAYKAAQRDQLERERKADPQAAAIKQQIEEAKKAAGLREREELALSVTVSKKVPEKKILLCAICGKPLPKGYRRYHPGECADRARLIRYGLRRKGESKKK